MRYYWLRDKTTHCQVKVFWEKGANEEVDYYTEH